jgi:hypothetical protein
MRRRPCASPGRRPAGTCRSGGPAGRPACSSGPCGGPSAARGSAWLADVAAATLSLRAGHRRAAGAVLIAARGEAVGNRVRLIPAAWRRGLVVVAGPRLVAVLKLVALAKAATRVSGRGPDTATTPDTAACSGTGSRRGTATASIASVPRCIASRGLGTVITVIGHATTIAGTAPLLRPVGELLGVLGSHVAGGQDDDDEDNHDNRGQDDHELCHRTIQQRMACCRLVPVRHARPSRGPPPFVQAPWN